MGASVIKKGRKCLLAKKIGMTQIFRDDGSWVPVTVLEVGPCTVLQVKSPEVDGYAALQVGFDETRKAPRRPQLGLFRKAGARPKRFIREIPPVDPAEVSRVPLHAGAGGTVALAGAEAGKTILERRVPRKGITLRVVIGSQEDAAGGEEGAGEEAAASGESAANGDANGSADRDEVAIEIRDSGGAVIERHTLPPGSSIEVADGDTVADGDVIAYVPVGDDVPEEVAPGMQIGVTLFRGTARVDVRGVTKGRGFQGCIKRHGFNAGDKSHGSKNVREPGSTGMHTDPGRVFKGRKMPGQTGNVQRKARALEVVEIDPVSNLMLVKGAVPGPGGGYVLVQESLKS